MFGRSVALRVLALAVVVLFVACSESSSPDEPETEAATEPAIEAVHDFHEAVDSGDIDAALDMLDPSQASTDADRHFWEFFHTISTYGIATELTDCVAEFGTVECRGVHKDAVAEALELPDGTYRYLYDGENVMWRPPDQVTLASGETDSPQQFLKGVYYDYLTVYYPEDYEEVCSPAGYDASSIIVIKGLAFTSECAELIGPLDQEMADWVRAGRPAP